MSYKLEIVKVGAWRFEENEGIMSQNLEKFSTVRGNAHPKTSSAKSCSNLLLIRF